MQTSTNGCSISTISLKIAVSFAVKACFRGLFHAVDQPGAVDPVEQYMTTDDVCNSILWYLPLVLFG